MGGNKSRTEKETIKGDKGTTYKIKDRSDKDYLINDKSLLSGKFDKNKTITITYDYVPKEYTYTVYYIDKDTRQVLADPHKFIDTEGKTITARPLIIDGYFTPGAQTFVLDGDKEIIFEYVAVKPSKPREIELVPETMRLSVGEFEELGYKLLPEGDYDVKSVDFKMVQNENVANINGKVITGREIGFGMMRVTAKGLDWELSVDGPVIVSGATGEE